MIRRGSKDLPSGINMLVEEFYDDTGALVESVELAPGGLLLRIGSAADFFVYYPHY